MGEVTIYTKPGCPYCMAAKDDFTRRGVQYEEHNVQADPAALRRMLELNGGQRRVPTIVQGNKATVGFQGF
jgi:glutaredoxin 3